MATIEEIQQKKRKLRGMLRELDGLSKGQAPKADIEAFRAKQRTEKNAQHKAAAAIYIPPPEDDKRRKRLEKDVFKWLEWYLPDVFTEPFQPHQKEMVEAILSATRYAGDQAIAAPRGEGKTTVAECVTIYCIIRGLIQFAVIFASTANDAENSLKSIKEFIADSDRMLADYPAICIPVREVEAVPAKAHTITVYGDDFSFVSARFQWSGTDISMPKIPGLICAESRIATRGLDSAVRGLKKGTKRPQLALIDDPDTEDSARSEDQAKKLSTRIERAIAGLAPKGKRMSRVMLTTLQNRTCVSAQFTDPKIKPSWKGKRFAFLKKMPERIDRWEEYITLRQQAISNGDEFARKAHNFYKENRKDMDAGCEVANKYSFDDRKLPDGSKLQLSTIQRYYDFVADNGEEAALCELQNNPPEETGPIESGITAHRVQRQVSGYPHRIVPPDVACVVQGIDVGKFACHFVVKAFRVDATAYVIDYGVQEVLGTMRGSDEALDKHILRALYARRESMLSNPYTTADGEIVDIQKTIVDAGYRTDAIYHFCREAGVSYQAAMGFGKSSGCVKSAFNSPVRVTNDKRPGDGWFLTLRPKGVWLCGMDTDRWKGWEHDRWMTPPDQPGTCLLFGERGIGDRLSDDQKLHFSFSKHITAEVESESPTKDKGMVRKWKVKSDTNHYFDASYMADVAANMCGITLLRKSRLMGGKRKTAQELADLAGGAK